MASIKDRLLALEALRPIHDSTDRRTEHAEYMASVMLAFVVDRADTVGGMVRRGIPEDEARRYSGMGFHAAQRELMTALHTLIEGATT